MCLGPIVTQVTPLKGFYDAEDYHQHYAMNTGQSVHPGVRPAEDRGAEGAVPELFRITRANEARPAKSLEERAVGLGIVLAALLLRSAVLRNPIFEVAHSHAFSRHCRGCRRLSPACHGSSNRKAGNAPKPANCWNAQTAASLAGGPVAAPFDLQGIGCSYTSQSAGTSVGTDHHRCREDDHRRFPPHRANDCHAAGGENGNHPRYGRAQFSCGADLARKWPGGALPPEDGLASACTGR